MGNAIKMLINAIRNVNTIKIPNKISCTMKYSMLLLEEAKQTACRDKSEALQSAKHAQLPVTHYSGNHGDRDFRA